MINGINLKDIDLQQLVNGWSLEKILNNGGVIFRNVNDEEQLFVAYIDTSKFIVVPIK